MKKLNLLFIMIIVFCFCGCHTKPYPHAMQMADSVINTYPDSALAQLTQIQNSIGQEPEEIQIYYQLLTIKAKDKAYIMHTSDSIIMRIVNYYESNNDNINLSEAYYYAGSVYRDLGDAPQALDYFQKVIDSQKENANNELLSRTYSQMGTLLLLQGLYDEALSSFKEAYRNTNLVESKEKIVYDLRDIGRAFTGKNKVDSTLYYYQKAEQTARQVNDDELRSMVNQELAGIYIQLGEYPKAFEIIQSSMNFGDEDVAPYYSVLASLYHETGKMDSANYYYTKLLSIGNYYQKQETYRELSRIARDKGNYFKSLKLMDSCLIYTDSINQRLKMETVSKMHSLFNYQLREKENSRLKDVAHQQRIWILILSLSILIFFIAIITGITIYRLRKKQQKIQREQQSDKLKRLQEEQYHSSLQFISDNEKRITGLQSQLQNTQNERSKLEQTIQEEEQELLELTNQRIKVKQRIQILSEEALKDSCVYKEFHSVAEFIETSDATRKQKVTQDDWEQLAIAINQTYDNFTERLRVFYPNISEQEMHICLLIKISILPMGIAKLTVRSKQAVTSSRKKLYEKVYGQIGTPEMWDDFIRAF